MLVIAIDGPAGAGKSTIARALAHRLGLGYLDTGAMYRSVAFAALQRGIDPDDKTPVAELARRLDIVVGDTVVVDGVDATIEIRGPEVTRAVSPVAANPEVRSELTRRMRLWAQEHGGGVIEGRDISSVVFPTADLKIYVTARPEVRAARRHQEATALHYDDVAAQIARRDELDRAREHGPLVEAEGSVIVDSSDREVDEIVRQILDLLERAE